MTEMTEDKPTTGLTWKEGRRVGGRRSKRNDRGRGEKWGGGGMKGGGEGW